MRLRRRLWNPYALVFLCSGCVMTVELVASRLIAPRVGVSLHTWTAVIGVTLAGTALGNYIGGKVADKRATFGVLGAALALASLACLGTLWLNNDLHEFTFSGGVPLMGWILFYVGGVFMLPTILLGCISPLVVRLSLDDLRVTGRLVGRVYAWSAAGSIAGTFATGFWLISGLGTKNTLLGAAGLLLVLGLWFLYSANLRGSLGAALCVVLFGLGIVGLQRGGFLDSECLVESDYFCINVNDTEVGGRQVRELLLDRLVHSYSDVDDPTVLLYDYERTYDVLLEPLVHKKRDIAVFFIGGGGYTFPRYLEATLPESTLVVAEIDPAVTEVAQGWLGLEPETRIRTFGHDARYVLARETPPGSYDVVFGDAFNDFSVPFHLTTIEFNRLVDRALRDDGLYLVNIIDGGVHGHFFRAYVRSLREVFTHVVVIPSRESWRESVRTTFVLAASQFPLDLSGLPPEYKALPAEALDEYLALEQPVLLSDDYVPVDKLMAPVVEDSFFAFELSPDMVSRIVPRAVAVASVVGVAVAVGAGWLVWTRRRRWLARRRALGRERGSQ